jgi:hypothetical protein
MEKGTRICKVCGKEYPYCKTERKDNAFRYQDVACCPEHGAEYLDAIMKSREIETVVEPQEEKPKVTRGRRKKTETNEAVEI